MKYEVTGDTIIIKYIADGKYKQLELNKNDNIDLDFFGQLIKAKNNKQDAMCDLYAKEVLSYDPSPERITTMSLTKVEEPSDYTKKESAKLRIEELTRDLKIVEKEIRDMLEYDYIKRRIEDLTSENIINKNVKEEIERFEYLKNKYISIKDQIEKEQKKYDVNSKKEILTQEQLVKKVADEFENKVSKVVNNSEDRIKVMEGIENELTPQDQLSRELQYLDKSIIDFRILLWEATEEEINNKEEKIKKQQQEQELKKKQEELSKKEEDDDPEVIKDTDMMTETQIEKVDENKIIKKLLEKKLSLVDLKNQIIEHIMIVINILQKTNIDRKLIMDLDVIIKEFKQNNSQTINDLIQISYDIITTIQELNNSKKIAYTKQTVDNVVKKINKVFSEKNKIQAFLNSKISESLFNEILYSLELNNLVNTPGKIHTITWKNSLNFSNNDFIGYYLKSPLILMWRQNSEEAIYTNEKIFGIGEGITIQTPFNYYCYRITKEMFTNNNYYILKDYITNNKTNFKLPFKTIDLYLNLKIGTTQVATKKYLGEYNVTYHGIKLHQTNMSNIINPVLELGENMSNNAGKIDLDRASTEEKLSEIIRLLQNIGYNLFTLTPNYEESERNKKLKSKGVSSKNSNNAVDLRELFRQKNT